MTGIPDPSPGIPTAGLNFNPSIELVYPVSIIQIDPSFLTQLKNAYYSDIRCSQILEILQANSHLCKDDQTQLLFVEHNGIIYAKPDQLHQQKRPVVPNSLQGQLFNYAYDQLGHLGYDRMHERLSTKFYVFDISKALRKYLWYCHLCQVVRTLRYKPYGSLQPILIPPCLFYTITIDFILALPKSVDGYDCAISVTDKFSKAITIIPGRSTWKGS